MGATLSNLTEGGGANGTGNGPGLGDIPESCVACVFMYLTPPEICNLARLNRAFHSAASSINPTSSSVHSFLIHRPFTKTLTLNTETLIQLRNRASMGGEIKPNNSKPKFIKDKPYLDSIIEKRIRLFHLGLLPNMNSATRAIGYRQAMEYLVNCREHGGSSAGDFYAFLSEFQKSSRNFAKRQMTWFRNELIYQWLDASQPLVM